jgi:hypothetical protein
MGQVPSCGSVSSDSGVIHSICTYPQQLWIYECDVERVGAWLAVGSERGASVSQRGVFHGKQRTGL